MKSSIDDEKFLSVIVPLYNKEMFIAEAIKSVLSQSHENFELIVVNDGSTDGSLEVVNSISDSRIKVLDQNNQGEGKARNSGIAAANSGLVTFLDADDAWFPDHLETIVMLNKKYPEAGLLSTRIISSRDAKGSETKLSNKFQLINYFKEAIECSSIVSSSSSAINLDVVNGEAYFKSYKFAADGECWIRLASFFPVANADKVTAVYNQDVGGVIDNLTANGAFFKRNILSLLDVSPVLHYSWTEFQRKPDQYWVGKFAYFNTIKFVRGALYWGEFNNAKKVCELTSKYSFKLKILSFVLAHERSFRVVLGVARKIKRLKRFL